MSEAYAQDRQFSVKVFHNLFGDPCFGRHAGAGRNHDATRLQPIELIDRDLIVAKDAEFFAELTLILNQVVGERVVIVDNGDHSSNLFCARAMARISARLLFTVSIYSVSGTE